MLCYALLRKVSPPSLQGRLEEEEDKTKGSNEIKGGGGKREDRKHGLESMAKAFFLFCFSYFLHLHLFLRKKKLEDN